MPQFAQLNFMTRAISVRWVLLLSLAALDTRTHMSLATEPPTVVDVGNAAPPPGFQMVKAFPVRVVDPEGNAITDAVVRPWALRSSQGHGLWDDDDDRSEVNPKSVVTNEDGNASVAYPYYRDLLEGTRTTSVSIFVDHRDFALPDAIHIDVPLENKPPFEIKLDRGVALELQPTIDGELANSADLYVLWSDERSWQLAGGAERTSDGTLRLPPLKPGNNSFLMARLDGDRVTHFSHLTDLTISSRDDQVVDVPLLPALRTEGVLSDNVPRPVTNGRIKLQTLAPAGADDYRVGWLTWVPIRRDGTFTIDAWPAGEKIELIALCDGFIAKSGIAPPEVVDPRDPASDPFQRPQVFEPGGKEPLLVEMEELVSCVVTVVDEDNKPVAGVDVVSWPNVCWWNNGSQIYCEPLVRCELLLLKRDYQACIDESFSQPFRLPTNGSGQVTLELPVGSERVTVISDLYELPVFLGRRNVTVELEAGQATEVTFRLQPRGTERLGDWDKLAGVVFGCSTREGRRICALPEVRKKMDEFTTQFREAKNQHDPKLLSEAYTMVADAFASVGDLNEATRWHQKAAEEVAKIESAD
jgi:hypothetical protein